MKCFYHNDLDGHCSGAIVKQIYPECEMIEINYGMEFPWDTLIMKETVFMVDFCLQPFVDMDRLSILFDLVWIDHHKTAIEEYIEHLRAGKHKLKGLREIGKAGCELTWEFFHEERKIPLSVFLLGRFDVWDHEADNRVMPFQMGMRTLYTNPDATDFWNTLINEQAIYYLDEILQTGQTILDYQNKQNKEWAKSSAFEIEFEGKKFIAMNRGIGSQLFDSVYDPEKHDGMMIFWWKKDCWSFSIYSNDPKQDHSGIAKKYGGGGHAGACGFQCKELPFEL